MGGSIGPALVLSLNAPVVGRRPRRRGPPYSRSYRSMERHVAPIPQNLENSGGRWNQQSCACISASPQVQVMDISAAQPQDIHTAAQQFETVTSVNRRTSVCCTATSKRRVTAEIILILVNVSVSSLLAVGRMEFSNFLGNLSRTTSVFCLDYYAYHPANLVQFTRSCKYMDAVMHTWIEKNPLCFRPCR